MRLNRLQEYRMSDGASLNPKRDQQVQHNRNAVAPPPAVEAPPDFNTKVQQAVDLVREFTGLRISQLDPKDPRDRGKYVVTSPKGIIIGQVKFSDYDGEIAILVNEELESVLSTGFKRAGRKLGVEFKPY